MRLINLAAVILLIQTTNVAAFDFEKDVTISGFFSFGGGLTDAKAYPGGDDPNDDEDSVNTEEETPKYTAGSGRFIMDDKLSFDQDTRAGLQLDFSIDDKTSASLQFVAKSADNNFDTDLSWAYLSHNIMPDLTIRGGRFRLPIYLASDYLDVGIAYPWIRPPTEVYSTINMSNLTGIDLLATVQFGDWIWSTQPFIGASEYERGDFTSSFRDLYGINSSLNWGEFTFRAAYMEYEYSVSPWPLNDEHEILINNLRTFGFSELEEYGNPNGRTTQFFAVGLQWKNNQWEIQSEWVRRNNATSGPDVDGYYITNSYQWKKWLPHITIAGRKTTNRGVVHPDNDVLPPTLKAAVDAITNALTGIEDNGSESITLGLNYNFSDSVIGKFEVSKIKNRKSTGLFQYATKNDTNHIVSFVIDAIF